MVIFSDNNRKETSNFIDVLKQRKTILIFTQKQIEETKALFTKEGSKLQLQIPEDIQEQTQKKTIIYKHLNAKIKKKKQNTITKDN